MGNSYNIDSKVYNIFDEDSDTKPCKKAETKSNICSIKTQKPVTFKIHIAIDFGTDGCAIAYYYNNEVIIYNKWMTKTRQRTTKAKTEILLNDKDEIVAFGDNAKIIYSSLSGKETKTWKFFDRFKMHLYEQRNVEVRQLNHKQLKSRGPKSNNFQDDKQETSLYLTSRNGPECRADIVFINAFKELGNIALDYMHKISDEDIKSEEIQWILTVPAIWSEKAKYKMKEWIVKAELVDINIKDHCLIVYESDCAALAMFQSMKPENNEDKEEDEEEDEEEEKCKLNVGDIYILIDAGGGTVDIASHKVVKQDAVEEVHYSIGNEFGSCCIDDEYIKELKHMFSKQWIEDFERLTPNTYLEIIDNFQFAKSKFYKKKNAKQHSVHLPHEFIEYLHNKCSDKGTTIENKLKQYAGNVAFVTLKDDTLSIDVMIWKKMFNKCTDQILYDVKELLKKDQLKQCKYIALVGGLSCSKYFKVKMKETFGDKLKVKALKAPSLSVVVGAAHFGGYYTRNKHFIKARILKYTYGVCVRKPLETAKAAGITAAQIQENRVFDSKGMTYVRQCFHILVKRNERVAIGKNKPYTAASSMESSRKTSVWILCTKRADPKIAINEDFLGELVIKHDVGVDIVTQFYFHGTMLTVSAYPEKQENAKHLEKQELQINYINKSVGPYSSLANDTKM